MVSKKSNVSFLDSSVLFLSGSFSLLSKGQVNGNNGRSMWR